MNSSDQYILAVSFNQKVPGVRLQLTDGNLNLVHEQEDVPMELNVPKGLYQLKISYLDFFQEKFFSVAGDTHLKLDFDYPFTVPSLDYKTTHEYYSGDAEHYSVVSTSGDKEKKPNFFFFAASYSKDHVPEMAPEFWLKSYSLYTLDKKVMIELSHECIYDNEVGKACFSTMLDPGLYFLHYKDSESPRIFPLYVKENYQTQFFIRYADRPDFSNCRIFFATDGGFRSTDNKYLLLEKLIYAYQDFRNFSRISESEIAEMKQQPYLVALVEILFASIPSTVARQYSEQELESPVQGCEKLDLPDLVYCSRDVARTYIHSAFPPILSYIFTRYAHQQYNGGLLFEPASVLDRIVDHLNFDIFWTNFSAIDEPVEWKEDYNTLLRTSKLSGNPLVRTFERARDALSRAKQSQVDENLGYLVGESSLDEAMVGSFTNAISKIKDLPEMSREFGLPPTTILRNYKKYTAYYLQVKEPAPGKPPGSGGFSRVRVVLFVCASVALLLALFGGMFSTGINNSLELEPSVAQQSGLDSFHDQLALEKEAQSIGDGGANVSVDTLAMVGQDPSESRDYDLVSIQASADTVRKFDAISKVLDDYQAAKDRFDNDNTNIAMAENYMNVTRHVLEVMQADSAYLLSRLFASEADSVRKLVSHLAFVRDSVRSPQKLVLMKTGQFKTPPVSATPVKLSKKFQQASAEVRERVKKSSD